jgi:hypothetical protein
MFHPGYFGILSTVDVAIMRRAALITSPLSRLKRTNLSMAFRVTDLLLPFGPVPTLALIGRRRNNSLCRSSGALGMPDGERQAFG